MGLSSVVMAFLCSFLGRAVVRHGSVSGLVPQVPLRWTRRALPLQRGLGGAAGPGWEDEMETLAEAERDLRHRRLFVQNLPLHVGWPELKDHFRAAGVQEVVYASVSVNQATGESKGYGIVEMATPQAAQEAIDLVSVLPLDGHTLSLRPDRQELSRREASRGRGRLTAEAGVQTAGRAGQKATRQAPDTKHKREAREARVWCRADDDLVVDLSEASEAKVGALVQGREKLRIAGRYEEADKVRDYLTQAGVKLDDRRAVWWVMAGVPDSVLAAKRASSVAGPGGTRSRRGGWKCLEDEDLQELAARGVDAEAITQLLQERDSFREAKDFAQADEIYGRLQSEHGILLNDLKKEWRLKVEDEEEEPHSDS